MLSNRIAPIRAVSVACFAAASLLCMMPELVSAHSARQVAKEKTPSEIQISFSLVRSKPAQAKKHPQLQALLTAGAQVIASPSARTLDGFPVEFKSIQQIPYLIGSGDNTKVATLDTGLRVRVVPHLNPDKTVQLDFDAENSEPTSKSNKPLMVAKYGVFNITQVKLGQETVVGTWMQGSKIVTVFATVTLPASSDGNAK